MANLQRILSPFIYETFRQPDSAFIRSGTTQHNKACASQVRKGGRFRRRQEADTPPEYFTVSLYHHHTSQWVWGKTNYWNDWRVRRAPLPSLLQMDIIKPLAGEWGLMTPSGPILDLNKRQKIKLRSKLQPACSRTVYQQCARKQKGEKIRGGLFFLIHLLLLCDFCQPFFIGPSYCRVLNEVDDLK